MICRKATFTVSVSAVTLSNAILRLPEHKNLDFVLKRPENEGSEGQKRTKMPILCSGMIAASPAAPTGAQHYPPRALRGASGSRTPGNRLPQPTTQPAVVHAPGQPTRWHTTVSKQPGYLLPLIPPLRYRQELLPGNLLPGILPCIPPTNLPPCATARELPPVRLPPGHTTLLWVPRPAGG